VGQLIFPERVDGAMLTVDGIATRVLDPGAPAQVRLAWTANDVDGQGGATPKVIVKVHGAAVWQGSLLSSVSILVPWPVARLHYPTVVRWEVSGGYMAPDVVVVERTYVAVWAQKRLAPNVHLGAGAVGLRAATSSVTTYPVEVGVFYRACAGPGADDYAPGSMWVRDVALLAGQLPQDDAYLGVIVQVAPG
jgi:hypothetical protein